MSGSRHEAWGDRPVTAVQRRKLKWYADALNFSDVSALVDYYFPDRVLSDLDEHAAHDLIVQCKIELNLRHGVVGDDVSSAEE